MPWLKYRSDERKEKNEEGKVGEKRGRVLSKKEQEVAQF